MPGSEEGPCSFANLQCTALKDVAPYEPKSAFVFHHCPCKFNDLSKGEKHVLAVVCRMHSLMGRLRPGAELFAVYRPLRRARAY